MTGSPSGREGPRLEITLAGDEHAEAVAQFIREVWNPAATPESVLAAQREGARRNLAEPGIPPPTWLALKGGRCLGYVTTLPVRLWNGGTDHPAYWIKGLMVLPEFRGGPIGYLVLKAAVGQLSTSGGFAVAPPARRLFEALGYRDLGPIPNFVRPLAPHRILQRLDPAGLGLSGLPGWTGGALRFARRSGLATAGGWAGGLALRGSAAALRLPALGLPSGPFDPEANPAALDALWQAARDGYRSTVARDARYLLDRYGAEPGGPYQWLAVHDGRRLAGVGLLRRPRSEGDERLKGIRVATLADVFLLPEVPRAGMALLGAVEAAARAMGAEAILASASSRRLQRLLKAQWYFPLGGNVHFLFRDVAGPESAFAEDLSDWWLTRGDGAADDNF